MKKNNHFLSISYIFFAIIIFSGCSDPSSNGNKVAFSGNVYLDGEMDHSNVNISLYKTVELDTTLVRINNEYPNIGLKISQETEFDFREMEPVYSTTSNAEGAWKIKDVNPGTYNIVAEKDSFGTLINCNVSANIINFELFKNIFLKSISNSNFVFESNKTYILNKDIILSNMPSIQFESNTRLILDSNYDLTINNSTLSFPDTGWVHITSSEGIVNAKIILEECNFDINRLIFRNINKGLKVLNCTNGIFKNSCFKDNGTAILSEFCTNLSIENVLLDKNIEGILPKSGTQSITNCVFYNNNKGLESLAGDVQLTNSLFLDNFIGATFISTQISKVEHSEFDRNRNSSLNIIGNNLEVYYNNFYRDQHCSIYVNSEWEGGGASKPLINNNNLISDKLAVSLLSNPSYVGTVYSNNADINAISNFWVTLIEPEISNRIFDFYDSNGLGKVDFSNYQLQKINSAGIQN